MKVRNNGRIMFAKGIELDRDIFPGEVTQVKVGFEQSERIRAALHSGSLETFGVINVRSQGGTVAIQPGDDIFAEFGKDLPLPKRVSEQQRANEMIEGVKARIIPLDEIPEIEIPLPKSVIQQIKNETKVEEERIPEVPVVEQDIITTQIIKDLKDETPLPVEDVPADEMTQFLRRNGGSRIKFIEEMKDVDALNTLLQTAKTEKTIQAVEARLKQLEQEDKKSE